MIKTFNYTGKNSIYKLETYLNKRRSSKSVNTSIVNKIIRDVKRNKNKAVLKYEKKFSQNNQLQPSKEKINKAIGNNPNYVKLQALEALKAISKDPASKIYFMNGDSPSPLPLMNIGINK